jgi:hypothetical protein
MTAKDYRLIADVLRSELEIAEHGSNPSVAIRTLSNLTHSLAKEFARDNARFDRDRFMRAVHDA